MPHDPMPLPPPEDPLEDPNPIEDPRTPAEERERASVVVPNKLIFAIALLLIVFLLAAVLGVRISIFSSGPGQRPGATSTPVYQQALDGQAQSQRAANNQPADGDQAALPQIGGLDPPFVPVDPLFQAYWEQHGGVRIFGHAISPIAQEASGRRYQWFERTRLEEWPEHAGSAYAIQPALAGVEFTKERQFPKQTFFPNQPELWYFAETGHGVGGAFLRFWLDNGGLDIFGYPISDELLEVLPSDGQVHTVQYFERARMEWHPSADGGGEVQLGLLGADLYLQNRAPDLVEPVLAPTPVPIIR